MTIFSVLTLVGGLAFFLYGMHIMSSGLERMSGGKLERILKKITSNPLKSLALGAGITIAIQSSSAVTVMLVGLVNSGIMELGQTIGVIMGSNIGTTLTAWILSLSGIDSDNIFINMLKPENFAPIIAVIGIIMIMMCKSTKKRDIGTIAVGFAILMYGMTMMSGAVSPLADSPQFSHYLTAFENPFLGIIIGAAFTGIIQSSAASVGVLQALSMTGGISYGMAIPIIMGQNIGTCVTALISSIGVNRNARKVSVVHISFNLIGTAVGLILYYIAGTFLNMEFLNEAIDPVGIALVHTIFNVIATLVLLPFIKKLEKLANFVIKDKESKQDTIFLDERLLNTPAFAISECNSLAVNMAKLTQQTLLDAIDVIHNFSPKKAETIVQNEKELDLYEDKLGNYLVNLSNKKLTEKDSKKMAELLHTIGDLERIGDHALNILKAAREINQKKITFSDKAKEELRILTEAITEILSMTTQAFADDDAVLAQSVEPLEQVIDKLTNKIRTRHIERLQKGACTIELGFILTDLLTNYERVSDHCSNIAISVMQSQSKGSIIDAHDYLNERKTSGEPDFVGAYNAYKAKYRLPKAN